MSQSQSSMDHFPQHGREIKHVDKNMIAHSCLISVPKKGDRWTDLFTPKKLWYSGIQHRLREGSVGDLRSN